MTHLFQLFRTNLLSGLALSLGLAVAGGLVLAVPAYAVDPLEKKLGCGSNISLESGTDCGVSGGTGRVEGVVKRVINVLSIIVGAVAVVMVIVGGFRYITSGGDANATKGARDTIIYALVGLVIVAIAQAIVQFVLQKT